MGKIEAGWNRPTMPAPKRLALFRLVVPLKKSIRHASHERDASESLVARLTLDDGSEGFGEGVPRPYVTGETVQTAFESISTLDLARALGRPEDYPAAVERTAALTLPSIEADPRGMFGNAARAALELAVLDAYGRAFSRSVGDAVRLACRVHGLTADRPTRVRYSGAITAESTRGERASAIKMRLYGFHQVKLKVGVAGQDDPARLSKARAILGRRMDIRLDANEAWSPDELLEKVEPLRRFRPSAIEQPVAHEQVGTLGSLRHRVGVPIMLDESLCGYPDGLRAVQDGTADLFNVRISKCGGIIPTLRLIELARRSGLGVQLGCHPGETGLLSAAGRHLASNVLGLRFVEGSYDRHLLARNLTVEDLTFRYGGWARPIQGPGLGVTVDLDALEAMTVERREFSFD